MNRKKISMILSFSLLPSFAAAQTSPYFLNIPEEFLTFPEILYFVVIPMIAIFTFIFSIIRSTGRFTSGKVPAIISLIITFFLLYFDLINYVVNILLSIDYYLPIFTFIILFFFGIGFYMRRGGERFYRQYRFQARKIKRERLPKLIGQREKAIARVESELTRLQAIEDQLEENYAASKNESIRKQLDRVRKRRAKLANRRDLLLQEKNQLNRIYKEAVT